MQAVGDAPTRRAKARRPVDAAARESERQLIDFVRDGKPGIYEPTADGMAAAA